MAEFYRKKRKKCLLCEKGVDVVNYKNVDVIRKFISADKGKILNRKRTGTCSMHQRVVAREVKKARFMALIPFVK